MKKGQGVEIYKTIAIIAFNTALLFLILNTIMYINTKFLDQKNPLVYDKELLSKAYLQLNESEIKTVIRESWSIDFEFEPYTQFKLKEYKGKVYNYLKEGIRKSKDQCSTNLSKENQNIFIFGGSTTQGIGVRDEDTIPSKLQEILNKNNKNKRYCVYNFGRTHYFSSQERILLEKLLLENKIPDIVIFIDGLNDYYYNNADPMFTDSFKRLLDEGYLKVTLSKLPLVQYIKQLITTKKQTENLNEEDKKNKEIQELTDTTNRYLNNIKLITAVSKEFNIKPYFVIQPVPAYNYNLSYHLFISNITELEEHMNSKKGYEILNKKYKSMKKDKNIIWLGDIQENKTENLYVDKVHYSIEFSKEIAQHIAKRIIESDI